MSNSQAWHPINTAPKGVYVLVYAMGWAEPRAAVFYDDLEIEDEDTGELHIGGGWVAHPIRGLTAYDTPDIWTELPDIWHETFEAHLRQFANEGRVH